MNKTWLAEELFPFLNSFYPKLEKELDSRFYHPKKVLRLFSSQKQINDWYGISDLKHIREFVDGENAAIPSQIIAPMGGYSTKHSGWVDVPALLNSLKTYFAKFEMLIEDEFRFDEISFEKEEVNYEGKSFKKIIFCEGWKVRDNPYFNSLPIIPNKGEMLELDIAGLDDDQIYNKNGFLLPREKGKFWLGATFNREDISTDVKDASKEKLKENLSGLYSGEYEISGELAGVRPTVKDRKPIIGIHPNHEQLAIFNGLGSKGVSLGPYFAEEFSSFLIEGGKLHSEVNIERYYSLF